MRSSKSRSRSKSNRPRSMGNIVNRVFDSSGPEGKVRGAPQQIIEKYLVLARDAQLSNDRVAHENFLQHAEHYTRMLGEAQRELAQNEGNRGENGASGQGADDNGQPQQHQGHQHGQRDRREREEGSQDTSAESESRDCSTDLIDFAGDAGDSGFVETPEQSGGAVHQPARSSAPKGEKPEGAKPRRPRGPRKPRAKAGEGGAGGASEPTGEASAAE